VRIISRYIIEAGETGAFIVFESKGLRRKRIVCRGRRVDIRLREELVEDEMSGLSHRVIVPVIVIDDCTLRPRWQRSRFVFDVDSVLSCRYCAEEKP
jgi:hypothetical protein